MDDADLAACQIASAIGEPARARMLYCLMDGRARTSTELAIVADVTPSTASVHLHQLKTQRLVQVLIQGKHRYYSLLGPEVATVLEGLSVLAGGDSSKFKPSTPSCLLAARTCYDHMAGTVGVALHDAFQRLSWLSPTYALTSAGAEAFGALGIDVNGIGNTRRRFAFACLDWSERRPHTGGALGAAILTAALTKKWVVREFDSRALVVTSQGRREMQRRLGLHLPTR